MHGRQSSNTNDRLIEMLLFARGSSGTGTRPAYLREIASGCIKVSINARDFQWLGRNIEPTGVNRSRMLFDGRRIRLQIHFSTIRSMMRNNFSFFLLSYTFPQLFLKYIYTYQKEKNRYPFHFSIEKERSQVRYFFSTISLDNRPFTFLFIYLFIFQLNIEVSRSS